MQSLDTLYDRLVKAYSDENLNRITGKLIELYKNKNYASLWEVANKLSSYFPVSEQKEAKLYTRLVGTYHPDRGENIRKSIRSLYHQNDEKALRGYVHVFLLDNIQEMEVSYEEDDIDYDPGYMYDNPEWDDFYSYTHGEEQREVNYPRTFFNELKYRAFGDISVEFPLYELELINSFEFPECGLESLDGVSYCTEATLFDFSDNKITDVYEFRDLVSIEELYLANNEIMDIDDLRNLIHMRALDISGNMVTDLSPLFGLYRLEYANVMDNPVPREQVEYLRDHGVRVVY
ncbi:leucine-rich repeat domain-containing protein [Algivirga pacifica]|uniref:Leucine-rich repeat domain-containing protein n=1 Tax=Algivirga pacifica TaxID=1162670 RepID=A0ABP9DFV3_9BACT